MDQWFGGGLCWFRAKFCQGPGQPESFGQIRPPMGLLLYPAPPEPMVLRVYTVQGRKALRAPYAISTAVRAVAQLVPCSRGTVQRRHPPPTSLAKALTYMYGNTRGDKLPSRSHAHKPFCGG